VYDLQHIRKVDTRNRSERKQGQVPLTAATPPRNRLKVLAYTALRGLPDMVMDVLVAASLVFALALINHVLLRIDTSDSFREFFARFHECACLGVYSTVSIRALIRLVSLDTR
jgi:hypothetical protein